MSQQNNLAPPDKIIPFRYAIIPLVLMIVSMIYTIVWLKGDPQIPLAFGTIVGVLVAWFHGFRWKDLEESFYDGIRLALPAVIIIMLAGMIIGSWLAGGVVATMVYYGLALITPSMFLVTICILCGIVSLSIGSSWATMGTVGVAGMGIAASLHVPAAVAAGAIISGSYFGDKMSPMSDTTNLASGLAEATLFDHIKHMFYTTIPGLVIALIVFYFMGSNFGGNANLGDIQATMDALQDHFLISPWLLLVPAITIALVAVGVPAIPALMAGVVLGFLSAISVQGVGLADAVASLKSGNTIESSNAILSELFNRGGIDDMMDTISMTLIAMTFGGVLEKTGMLREIVSQLTRFAKTPGRLVGTTVLSSFATNITCAEQYISIVVPARMYAQSYKDMKLAPKNLSRALEDGGTLTSPFVPWNTCGIFIMGILGVGAFEYAPYAVLNYSVPLIALVYASLGLFIPKRDDSNDAQPQQA